MLRYRDSRAQIVSYMHPSIAADFWQKQTDQQVYRAFVLGTCFHSEAWRPYSKLPPGTLILLITLDRRTRSINSINRK